MVALSSYASTWVFFKKTQFEVQVGKKTWTSNRIDSIISDNLCLSTYHIELKFQLFLIRIVKFDSESIFLTLI